MSSIPMFKNAIEPDPFPAVYLGGGIHARIMTITPTDAKSWLGQLGPKQRKLRPAQVAMLTDDLKGSRWRLTCEPIIFDADGTLVDGQHRLNACIKSGVPIMSLVIWGAPIDAYPAIDASCRRTGADALTASGHSHSVACSRAVLLLSVYEKTGVVKTGAEAQLSPIAVQEFIETHPDLLESVNKGMAAGRVLRSQGVGIFCHYVLSKVDKDDADFFFDSITTGAELKKGSPILTLRNKMSMDSMNTTSLVAIVFKAWNAFRKGKTCMILKYNGLGSEGFPEPI